MPYITKTTFLGNQYGCRIFKDGVLIVEGRCKTREEIGPTFRDLFRTLDKLGGDEYTAAVRKRKFKEGNKCVNTRHYWGGKKK